MMPKAKDLMTKSVVSVKRDTPIYDALKVMSDKNITGVPVVDDDMALLGILSEKDALSLLYDSEYDSERIVDDFMTQPAIHFDEEEDVEDVCDCLMNNYFRRVPVTSNGKLLGIISRKDIIDYILQTRCQNNEVR